MTHAQASAFATEAQQAISAAAAEASEAQRREQLATDAAQSISTKAGQAIETTTSEGRAAVAAAQGERDAALHREESINLSVRSRISQREADLTRAEAKAEAEKERANAATAKLMARPPRPGPRSRDCEHYSASYRNTRSRPIATQPFTRSRAISSPRRRLTVAVRRTADRSRRVHPEGD